MPALVRASRRCRASVPAPFARGRASRATDTDGYLFFLVLLVHVVSPLQSLMLSRWITCVGWTWPGLASVAVLNRVGWRLMIFFCVRVVVVRWVRSEEPSAGSQGGKGLAQDVFFVFFVV